MYVTVDIIARELDEFKNYWNSHKIRSNKKSSLPSGIPNNLYSMPTVYSKYALSTLYVLHIGVADHLQPVNGDLWTYAMISESLPVPQFYPNSFKNIVKI